MTADKMFEELGYEKKLKNEAGIKLTMAVYENKDKKRIEFWSPLNISIRSGYAKLSVQELKAINEKVKELGWYD